MIIIPAIIISCDEVDKLLTFNIKNEMEFVIPATVGVNTPFPIPTPDIETNSQQEFENNNTKKDLVKDVKLTSLSLEITSPSGKTFSFLKSINLYIKADGLAEKKLAYLESIPANVGSKIDLITTKEKLDEYIKKDAYDIRTEVVTDEAFVSDISVKAKMNFKVTADVL